mmetsp:Transcript_17374/g.34892  ORF Transcript_17374/g.34892 Transcript_17374/m.34892 type:complete len:161 (-) Transcript_17374:76-558(-)|eukprot:CAMPEP_0182459344 /NCGR_PEP_ID=MMETSP1319-20130603/4491_1 /TAXON_ID=172717 /ORGANISM="Bolidomonas pacifica, Strain RCC208" /LENGTH=160 /DNA_ID=CAMNT_0024658239 /DNA_START=51 /DNA_END=533 /DNA_ORIENTATION=+
MPSNQKSSSTKTFVLPPTSSSSSSSSSSSPSLQKSRERSLLARTTPAFLAASSLRSSAIPPGSFAEGRFKHNFDTLLVWSAKEFIQSNACREEWVKRVRRLDKFNRIEIGGIRVKRRREGRHIKDVVEMLRERQKTKSTHTSKTTTSNGSISRPSKRSKK